MYVIQTENGQICTDMGIQLYRASEFANWRGIDQIKFRLQEDFSLIHSEEIPVGTLEWTEAVSGHRVRVTNIPEYLWHSHYVQRKLGIGNREALKSVFQNGNLFVKSNTQNHKFEANIFSSIEQVPEDAQYFWSEPVCFQSEWRVFVLRGEILDVRQYLGAWDQSLKNTEISFLKEFVQNSRIPYSAYTADFGRTSDGMELIEIHNFISCGLYGFECPFKIRPIIRLAWNDELK